MGHISYLNVPGWGPSKGANAPPPELSPINTSAVFVLIREKHFSRFGTLIQRTVRLEGQHYKLVVSDEI